MVEACRKAGAMTVKSKGEQMVEALERLRVGEVDEPMIGRPRGAVLHRSPFQASPEGGSASALRGVVIAADGTGLP